MKLRFGVNVAGTETFRFAMSKDPFGYGCNAQTLPKSLKYYIVPPQERIFAGGDLSQAEARVVAYLSRCQELIDLFNDPHKSIHLENALAIFGHAVEKDSPEYTLAKMTTHASNYRMGPKQFSVQSGIDPKTCKQLLDKYHSKRPEIRKWHNWIWDEIKNRGSLITPLGDKRVFYEAISAFNSLGKMLDTHWKDAISWVPQTTVPHVTNLGIIDLYKTFEHEKDYCWWHHQGHDSFLCSIPEGEVQRFAQAAEQAFKIELGIWGKVLIIPIELSFGYSFGDMMNWDGSAVTRDRWDAWLSNKLLKKSRVDYILDGTYGAILNAWRP